MFSISSIAPTFSTEDCRQAYEVELEILKADYLRPEDQQTLLHHVYETYPHCYIKSTETVTA